MLHQIRGLHHVTALAGPARACNAFWTGTMGLRRVKKTVNFDAPEMYHLYFGTGCGAPGSLMTCFPRAATAPGRRGRGEVSPVSFAIPPGSAGRWQARLAPLGPVARDLSFGAERLAFAGPDGERLALVETPDDPRAPWTGGGVEAGMAIRGLAGVELCLAGTAPTAALLGLLGYAPQDEAGDVARFALPGDGPARWIDLRAAPGLPPAIPGAGSVHHIAFAVETRARQLEVAEALAEAGFEVTPPRDRGYFWSIYFRAPGGLLFEVATAGPGFACDEPEETLGTCLKLPGRHEYMRGRLERSLEPLG